jgi:hypothetical protein
VRALWFERQALTAAVSAPIADSVRDTGWLTTAGGHGTYLALRARIPGLHRADVDHAALEEGSLVEIPAARACVMTVPRADAALALRAAEKTVAAAYEAAKKTAGVTAREIHRLSSAIVDALGRGPLAGDDLRAAIPAKLVRSLGDAGKKIGESTTLALALRLMQANGTVERRATGRLDARRFSYLLFEPRPLAPGDGAPDLALELTRRFFAWAGPATRAELAWWTGLAQGVAREAMVRASLSRVDVDGWDAELWMLEEDVDRLRRARFDDGFTFLPFRDNYLGFRRGLDGLVDPAVRDRSVAGWENGPATVGGLTSLHHHFIVAKGLVVGIWEYDPADRRVVWGAFGDLSAAEKRALKAEAERTAAFAREELGDVRFYALDSDKNRAGRLAAVRRL